MKPLEHLVDDAIIGTQGSPPPGSEWDGLTPEQALLKQLATAAVMRRAGFVAGTGKMAAQSAPPPPPETLPTCSETIIRYIMSHHRAALTQSLAFECIAIIIQRRKRVPHWHLHVILNISTQHPSWAPFLLQIIGERGKWLIQRGGFPGLEDAYRRHILEGEPLPDLSQLELPAIPESSTYLLDQRKKMLEALAHE